MARAKFLGRGLPYQALGNLKGRLIVVEGTDGVGRTEQITRLRDWLEVQGYGVVETGWTRSQLMSNLIELAKEGNTLTRHTFSLLYATDFADRLENTILPALKAGFVVLSDRYVYTAFARHVARGGDPTWIRNVYGFALEPDIVIYLRVEIESLIPRVLQSKGMNYWESGIDVGQVEDLFDSFVLYQTRMIELYDRMAKEFGFVKVETAERNPAEIHEEIKKLLEPVIRKIRSVDLQASTFPEPQAPVS